MSHYPPSGALSHDEEGLELPVLREDDEYEDDVEIGRQRPRRSSLSVQPQMEGFSRQELVFMGASFAAVIVLSGIAGALTLGS